MKKSSSAKTSKRSKTPSKSTSSRPRNLKVGTKSPLSPGTAARNSPKQAFLPSKLTLTINFGTKDNPKSRSKAKRPKSAVSSTLYNPSPRGARMNYSARRRSSSGSHNNQRRGSSSSNHNYHDAHVKYDANSGVTTQNPLVNSPRYASANSIPSTPRRYSNSTELNLNLQQGKLASPRSVASPRPNHQQDSISLSRPLTPRSNPSQPHNSQKLQRHNSLPTGLDWKSQQNAPTSYQMAEALQHTKEMHRDERAQSARPSQKPDSSHPLQHRARVSHQQPAAESDYSHVKYNYSFLKKPVSKMSPRFANDMSRYKENYRFIKSRLHGGGRGGGEELLMGLRNSSTFSSSDASPRERPSSSVPLRRHTVDHIPMHSEERGTQQRPQSAAAGRRGQVSKDEESMSPSEFNTPPQTEEHNSDEETGEDQPVDRNQPVSIPKPAPLRSTESDAQEQPKEKPLSPSQNQTSNVTQNQASDQEQQPHSPSFSFQMEALPPPKYFVSTARQEQLMEQERQSLRRSKTPKRPMSAAAAGNRSARRRKPKRRSSSALRRPASAASTSHQRTSRSSSRNSQYSSGAPSKRNAQAIHMRGNEPMFGVFPPARTISNQFFSRQRIAMNMKKMKTYRDNQKKLNQLLSTETMNSTPRQNGVLLDEHNSSISSISSNNSSTRDDKPNGNQSSLSRGISGVASRKSPSQTDKQQQDIIDYYKKNGGASKRRHHSVEKHAEEEIDSPSKSDSGAGIVNEPLPESMQAQLQKDESSPKHPNGLSRIQTSPSNSKRSILSPSPVSPVLFSSRQVSHHIPGTTSSSMRRSFNGGSPGSPVASIGGSRNRREGSPQQRRSSSVSGRMAGTDCESLQIGSQNASSRFLSNTSPLVEDTQSGNMTRQRPSSASASSRFRNTSQEQRGSHFSLLSTPSHLFEYKERPNNIDSPIQIGKKELNPKVSRSPEGDLTTRVAKKENGTTSRRSATKPTRKSPLSSGGVTRPSSARPQSAKKSRKSKAIKIKTTAIPAQRELLDSPLREGLDETDEANLGESVGEV